jgi:hypothetical protein
LIDSLPTTEVATLTEKSAAKVKTELVLNAMPDRARDMPGTDDLKALLPAR